MTKRKSANVAYPLFSDMDSDLRNIKWRVDKGGYPRCTTKKQFFNAHRIVLARMLNRPLTSSDICDHVNRNRLDCRRENLQLVDGQKNAENRKPSAVTGYRGVTYHKRSKKWQSQVFHLKKRYYSYHDTAEEAALASHKKRTELNFHGETENQQHLRNPQ